MKQMRGPEKGDTIANIKTNMGEIKVVLFPEAAPKAVENFVTHAKDGYYDGVIFHRVIDDFMIQGGDPTGTGRGGESIYGRPFEDEFDLNYRNIRGALSMANAGPGTNGSQFFIVQGPKLELGLIDQMRELGEDKGYPEAVADAYEEHGGAHWLDFKHTVFGQVYEGIDVVDRIAGLEKDPMDKPFEDVIIETVEVGEYQ